MKRCTVKDRSDCPDPRILGVFSRMVDLLHIEEAIEMADKICEAHKCSYLKEGATKK